MADLRFDYKLIQDLINLCENTRSGFEGLGQSLCPSLDSDDPVASHHMNDIRNSENKILSDSESLFNTAKGNSQDTYDIFKAADNPAEGE